MATSIRLAPETEQRLDYLASQTGRTKAFYLREIIERGIEDMEDYYLLNGIQNGVLWLFSLHASAHVWLKSNALGLISFQLRPI